MLEIMDGNITFYSLGSENRIFTIQKRQLTNFWKKYFCLFLNVAIFCLFSLSTSLLFSPMTLFWLLQSPKSLLWKHCSVSSNPGILLTNHQISRNCQDKFEIVEKSVKMKPFLSSNDTIREKIEFSTLQSQNY